MTDLSLLDRVPPQSLEAEQSTLGSMMIDKAALRDGVDLVRPSDFYRVAHQTVFEALVSLAAKNEPADIATVQEELRTRGRLDAVGGTEYLATLIDSVPTSANLGYYAEIVKEKAILRRLIDIGTRMVSEAHGPGDNLQGLIGAAYDELMKLAKDGCRQNYQKIAELLPEAWEQVEDWHTNPRTVTGVPIGIHGIERMTGGWQPRTLNLVAARPSQGKTALMLQCARVAARAGYPAGIISIEMDSRSLLVRLLAHSSRVSMTRMRRGDEQEDEWARLADAYGDLYELPIYLNDSPDFHVRDLPVIVRSMAADGVKVVFLDYLQLMDCENLENRQVEVSRLAQIAKRTARQTDIPLVCMAQLNRALESRKDGRPILSDLRESGRLEAESDLIVMVHNPGLEADPENRELYDAELIVRKQRNGPKGTIRVKWHGDIQSFHDVARYSELEGNEKTVFDVMSTDKMRPDEIARDTGLSIQAVGSTLSMLEISGLVKRWPGNQYTVREK